MSQKKWYRYNVVPSKVPNTDSILEVTLGTFDKLVDFIEESFTIQNNKWSLSDARDRLLRGDKLFLLRNYKASGHLWLDGNHLYDVFVNEVVEGQAANFVRSCCERAKKMSVTYCINDGEYVDEVVALGQPITDGNYM
jgi:hypothetical protein